MNIIEVEELVKNYRKFMVKEDEGDIKVLKKISFKIEKGEFRSEEHTSELQSLYS